MSTKIHANRGLLVDKSVHEKSPFDNVHEKSPIWKKKFHEMSLFMKCLQPADSKETIHQLPCTLLKG